MEIFQKLTAVEWTIIDAAVVGIAYIILRGGRRSGSQRIESGGLMGAGFWGLFGFAVVAGLVVLWLYGAGRLPKL